MSVEEVLAGERRFWVEQSDCIDFFRRLPTDSVDLVFGSPPYMDARTYDDGTLPAGAVTVRDCQEWVNWMLDVTEAAVRVSKGLVLWVVSGVQRDKCYWPGCEGLAWEWWKRGNHLWRPCIWWKVDVDEGGTGIPGSGGKQWLRNDWEYVLAFKREGWLPWADPLVMGHTPVYDTVGGEMSNRLADGGRANDPWDKRGRRQTVTAHRKHGKKVMYARNADGRRDSEKGESYTVPKIANPGNCIVVKARVGGGHMGSNLCHENEAPFPEDLATFFVRSFCPPKGIVADCFSGSGTTAAVSVRCGRRFVGCDLRESQVALACSRLECETPPLPGMEDA